MSKTIIFSSYVYNCLMLLLLQTKNDVGSF